MDELTREFIAESQEGLDRMEQCLTTLETRPDDPELVAEIFRAVHTIKGTTGFLGFKRLETLAHAGENLLGQLRDGRIKVSRDLVNGLLSLLDGLRGILVLIDTTGKEGVRAGDDDAALVQMMGSLCVKGPAPASISKATPIGMVGQHGPAVIGGYVGGVRVEKPVPPAKVPGARRSADDDAADTFAAAGVDSAGSSEKTLRVDVEVLNRMMNLVGELVLTRNQILRSNLEAHAFSQLGRRLDAVTADLRETVMQARMQPVGNLFSKFPRMVRDLAQTCGKMVRIEFSGHETGLDKSLLAAVKDPLTHAVRNAVDHGIESPVTRVKAGKQVEGTIRMRAFHQGGSVTIEVADDGGGIPVARVREKALERGLITAERAQTLTERDVLQLVFLPGFSTAPEVTHVSGRGVGMDVVRANVEKVGGTVELESNPGKGTTLRLRVPLTLAIVPVLVVVSGGESFAIPQTSLVELVYVPAGEAPLAMERIGATLLYRLRERLLPMVRLDHLLRMPGSGKMDEESFYLAVLETDGNRFGLVLENLLAPEEIVVKPLTAVLREIGLFSGATVLGNGNLALILDIPALAARAGIAATGDETAARAADETAGEQEVPRYLVFESTLEPAAATHGVRTGQRMAIALEQVERIESVPVASIEYAGDGPLLQYRGTTLLLDDIGQILEPGQGQPVPETVTVLICVRSRQGRRGFGRFGLVVREVFHVAGGSLLAQMDESGGRQLAMVDGLITMLYAAADKPSRSFGGSDGTLREVA